ncbi:MAG: DUF4388 domain-containing protein [Deltaproteobacteria bacterium]|nr:DUF4388 domain-containing protein [Deltaproteobacteria bacterium]
MTLRGSLSDLGSVQLVQFPYNGRKTGELFISNRNAEARFYYHEGNLIHAATGKKTGIDVLIDVLGWTDGEFEFRTGVRPERRSIEQDLHQVLMMALVAKDERERRNSQMHEEKSPELIKKRIQKLLDEFVTSTTYVQYSYIQDSNTNVIAISRALQSRDNLKRMQDTISSFVRSYPGELGRAFFESEEGMITIMRLVGKRYLIMFTNPEASLGMITVKAGKLAASLDETLSPKE